MVEVTVPRKNNEVHEAMVQFAARRSYRLSKPWWIEGIRIEAPQIGSHQGGHSPARGGFWASLFDIPQIPRIEVHLKRRRGRARLKINVSNHPESIQLAYELHSYLLDDRAYDCQCPPICTKCGSPVRNVTARYCGRCGHQLVSEGVDHQLPSMPERMASPPLASRRKNVTVPPVTEPEPMPVANDSNESHPTRVTIERDDDVAVQDSVTNERDDIEASSAVDDRDILETEPLPDDSDHQTDAEESEDGDGVGQIDETDQSAPETAVVAKAEEEAERAVDEVEKDETDIREEIPPRRALAED
ncbi:MAG: hypothetical protein MI923_09900 [Phycisphaerales bacterium]|nr:hypothetical protein [Phycisphaerales bacterium]